MSHFSQNQQAKENIKRLGIFVGAVFLLMGARTGQLMLVKETDGVDLEEYAQVPTQRSSIREAKRGTIYDQKGQPIAIDTTSYSMYALLDADWTDERIGDPDHTAKVLSQYIDLSRDEILDLLLQEDVAQVEFGAAGSNLSPDTKNAIENENLPGIHFTSQTQRKYTNDYFASHLIGYASKDGEETDFSADILTGQIGIEAAYDDYLSGLASGDIQDGQLVGNDLSLTLDSRLQNQTEDVVEQAYQRFQPENVMAYVVNMDTGGIEVASQRPSFNLNTLEGIENEWRNLLVEESLEPGSTMKILTQAAAIDRKAYRPGETFASGAIEVYDQIVRDYNQVGWGEITFEEGLARSSNVGMVNLVNRMGLEEWEETLGDFGFGESTDSGLPNELPGSVDFDNPVNATMSGFGQGILTTPMQLLQAYSSIGNEGKMLRMQYVQPDEGVQAEVLGQPITSQAANEVLNLMVDTVEMPYGTAQSFSRPDMQVAAKTGTAQIANPDGPGYLTGTNDYYHSVVAFLPAEDPQYMVYIAMKRPTVSHGLIGSQMVAEVFHGIVDQMMIGD